MARKLTNSNVVQSVFVARKLRLNAQVVAIVTIGTENVLLLLHWDRKFVVM